MAGLTRKVIEVEVSLQAERVALATEREKAHKSAQALKATMDLASRRDA